MLLVDSATWGMPAVHTLVIFNGLRVQKAGAYGVLHNGREVVGLGSVQQASVVLSRACVAVLVSAAEGELLRWSVSQVPTSGQEQSEWVLAALRQRTRGLSQDHVSMQAAAEVQVLFKGMVLGHEAQHV